MTEGQGWNGGLPKGFTRAVFRGYDEMRFLSVLLVLWFAGVAHCSDKLRELRIQYALSLASASIQKPELKEVKKEVKKYDPYEQQWQRDSETGVWWRYSNKPATFQDEDGNWWTEDPNIQGRRGRSVLPRLLQPVGSPMGFRQWRAAGGACST